MAGKLAGHFVATLALVLDSLSSMYLLILLGAVITSWVNADPYNPIVRFLRAATDPVLYQIRRRFPFVIVGNLDLSPLVVFIALMVVRSFLVPSLHDLALELRFQ